MGLAILSPEERERILRQNWWGHDGRWFMMVAAELGFEKANRMNMAVNRAVGKLEMKNFLAACGAVKNEVQHNMLYILKTNLELVAEDVFAIRDFRQEGSAYNLTISECAAHKGTTKAGYAGQYECACFQRCEGWLDAMDLNGTAHIVSSLLKGDSACHIRIEIDK